MGSLQAGSEVVDDFILIKPDGFPTYNFAHIVDDAEMKITHIIRGQEFISSQPNYLNLYEALDHTPPIFATVPHILSESGNKKLSKRDGAKDILSYIHDGYLPEALINFIASMGWNDGTEQEIFTRDELIEKFSLSRVQRSGARFDQKRLLWMNGQHIRNLSVNELYERVENFWPDSAKQTSEESRIKVLTLVQDRLKTLADLPTLTDYFFVEPVIDWLMVTENKQLSAFSHDEIIALLKTAKTAFETSEFDGGSIQATLNTLLEMTRQKPSILFGLIRLAVSWAAFSPALNDTLAILGKETVLTRLQAAIDSPA
jgi:glutamyl-tRNA synthetase